MLWTGLTRELIWWNHICVVVTEDKRRELEGMCWSAGEVGSENHLCKGPVACGIVRTEESQEATGCAQSRQRQVTDETRSLGKVGLEPSLGGIWEL